MSCRSNTKRGNDALKYSRGAALFGASGDLFRFDDFERRLLLVVAAVSAGISVLLGSMLMLAFNFFLILLVFSSAVFHRLFADNLQGYRKFHDVALTGDRVKVELGVANYNPFPFYNAIAKDTFYVVQHSEELVWLTPFLAPRKVTTGIYHGYCGKRRGRFTVGPLSVTLTDPFGLGGAVKVFEETSLLNVYPRGFPIGQFPLAARSSQFDVNIQNAPKSGVSDEFRGLREYKHGDSLRWIHWKSTLRHQRYMVKDFELPAAKNVTLLLDLNHATYKGLGTATTLEYSVSIAMAVASYAVRHLHKVSLAGQGAKPLYVPPGSGDAQLQVIMDALLAVEQDGTVSYDDFLLQYVNLIPIDSCAVLVFPTSLIDIDRYLKVIGIMQARYINVVAVLIRDELFFRVFDRDYSREVAFDQVVDNFLAAGVPVYAVDSRAELASHFAVERRRELRMG